MNPPAWMGSVSVGTVAVSLFVMLTLGALIWALLRPVVRSARSTDKTLQELRRDWFGQEGRPGFPAVPGVPQRLYDVEQVLMALRPIVERIEAEMHTNGGGSLRDLVLSLRDNMETDRLQSVRDITTMKSEISAFTRALDNSRTLRALAAHAEQQDPLDDERKTG
jgi:hypothetical protein